jgi:hypothetical protein
MAPPDPENILLAHALTMSNICVKFVLEIIERKISVRAYEIFQSRGNAEGSTLGDWLRAEEEF